jgi:hypothetical protein
MRNGWRVVWYNIIHLDTKIPFRKGMPCTDSPQLINENQGCANAELPFIAVWNMLLVACHLATVSCQLPCVLPEAVVALQYLLRVMLWFFANGKRCLFF